MLLKKIVFGIPRRLRAFGIYAARWVRYWRWYPFYRIYYHCLDALARRHMLVLTPFNLRCYARGAEYHPEFDSIVKAKQFGMLHPEVLLLLRYFALGVRGAVFEIGAFTGSATVVLAKALKEAGGGPYFSAEAGGVKEHPILATNDIFADLERHVREHGVSDAVVLLNGRSHFPHIHQTIAAGTKSAGIGLLVVDADGRVQRDLEAYGPLLNDGCLLVVDDYLIEAAENNYKMGLVKPYLDGEVAAGRLQLFGVFGFSTWVGRYWEPVNGHTREGKSN